MFEVLKYAPDFLPSEKPRYLMGVGKPDDIVGAVKNGIDSDGLRFTVKIRRTGQIFTHRGVLNIKIRVIKMIRGLSKKLFMSRLQKL